MIELIVVITLLYLLYVRRLNNNKFKGMFSNKQALYLAAIIVVFFLFLVLIRSAY